MNRILLTLAATAALAACQHTTEAQRYERPPGPGYHVTLTGGLERVVTVANERMVAPVSDYPVFQMDLYNGSLQDVHAEVQISWFDEQGMEIRDVTKSWRPYVLPPEGRIAVKMRSSSKQATQCEVMVRMARPLGG